MQKIHGGSPLSFQTTAGSLTFLKIACTGGTFLDEGSVVGSDLELVLSTIGLRSTVVISNAISNTAIHVAIENAGEWDVEGDASFTELEAAILEATSASITVVAVTPGTFQLA
jgi:hypothetical protein